MKTENMEWFLMNSQDLAELHVSKNNSIQISKLYKQLFLWVVQCHMHSLNKTHNIRKRIERVYSEKEGKGIVFNLLFPNKIFVKIAVVIANI